MLSKIIGNIQWTAPNWLCKLNKKKVSLWSSGFLLLLLIIVGYWIFKPTSNTQLVQWTVSGAFPPEIKTPKQATPLIIVFTNDENKVSVAPLKLIGNLPATGTHITPKIAGHWQWKSGNELRFLPINPWPAGMRYTIKLDKNSINSDNRLPSYQRQFTTPKLNLTIKKFTFNINLKDPRKKNIVATLSSNYPLDKDSLKKSLTLAFQQSPQAIPYTLKFAKHQREVYVTSTNIELPKTSRFAVLKLAKGIKPSAGNSTSESQQKTTKIPALDSLLAINRVSTDILRDKNNVPHQALIIHSNIPMDSSELEHAVSLYQLPEKHNNNAHYEWQLPGEVTKKILQTAKKLPLTAIADKANIASTHAFAFQADAGRYLFVKINHGIKAVGNFHLATDYKTLVNSPSYPKKIDFLRKGSLLALADKKQLTLQTRGLAAVKFTVSHILNNDLNQFITQSGGDFSAPYFNNYNFSTDNISQVYRKIIPLNPDDKQNLQYPTLVLNHYLQTNKHKLGLFFIHAEGWNSRAKRASTNPINRVILVTDMATIDKTNIDGSRELFVQSITSAKPVANAKVNVLGKNGMAIFQGKTAGDGHLSIPSLKKFTNEKQAIAIVVKKGDDVSFIPINRYDRYLNYSRFSIGGVNDYQQGLNRLQAYGYNSQAIYRPGETVHMGFVVKSTQWAAGKLVDTQGVPVQFILRDPQGKTVLEKHINLTRQGLITETYKTDKWAAVGGYQASLYLLKNNKPDSFIGSTFFRVTDFVPDSLRIHATLNRATDLLWVKPNQLSTTVNLQNLFGKPAQGHRITASLQLTPGGFKVAKFPNYQFFDPLYDSKKPPQPATINLPTTKTDAKGNAKLVIDLSAFSKASYQLNLRIQGFEKAGGRSVTAQINQRVSPLDYLVGVNTAGSLNFLTQHSQRKIHLIAINPHAKTLALPDVNATLYQKHQTSVLVQKADGTYEYQTVSKRQELNSQHYQIKKSGVDVRLITTKAGDYVWVLTDKQGNLLSQVNYTVVGAGELNVNKKAQLMLNVDKKRYRPGDWVNVAINAPYAGSGLITIESDKVYHYQWVHLKSSNGVVRIQIPKNLQQDAYINVMWIRDWQATQRYIDPLSYAVVPIKISHVTRDLGVSLKVPKVVKSGEKLTIHYQAKKAGKVIIFAVNEGVLQVTNYPSPAPLAYFFRKKALTVRTAQTLDLVMPRAQTTHSSAAGGGNAAEQMRYAANKVNPFQQKTIRSAAYWSGIVDVSQQEKSVSYRVPDWFNGKLRVMAVAAGDNNVGSAQASVLARNDFIITPSLPSVVAPQDSFSFAVTVTNNVPGQAVDATVKVSNPDGYLQIIGNDTQAVKLANNGEKTFVFTVKAKDTLGIAKIHLQVSGAGKQSQLTQSISIRPAVVYSTNVISKAAVGNADIDLKNNQAIYPQQRKLQIRASANPLVLASGLMQKLLQPNDDSISLTTELVSQLAALAADNEFHALSRAQRDKKIATLMDKLRQRQTDAGGFSLLLSDANAFQFPTISLSTLDVLTTLQQQGYQVPSDLLVQGIRYLKQQAEAMPSTKQQAQLQAYAIFLLARNEIVVSNALAHLQSYLDKQKHWQNTKMALYLAASYQLLQQTTMANQLLDSVKLKEADAMTRTEYLRIIASYFPQRVKNLSSNKLNLLLAPMLTKHDFSPMQSVAWITALSAYGKQSQSIVAPLRIEQQLAAGKPELLVQGHKPWLQADFSALAKKLIIKASNNQRFFYQLIRAGYNSHFYQTSASNLTDVAQSIVDKNGKPINTLAEGEQATVIIRLRAKPNTKIDYYSGIALLPAGVTVVPEVMRIAAGYTLQVRNDRVLFTAINSGNQTITLRYKIRAINPGHYTVPAVVAIGHDMTSFTSSVDYGKAAQLVVK